MTSLAAVAAALLYVQAAHADPGTPPDVSPAVHALLDAAAAQTKAAKFADAAKTLQAALDGGVRLLPADLPVVQAALSDNDVAWSQDESGHQNLPGALAPLQRAAEIDSALKTPPWDRRTRAATEERQVAVLYGHLNRDDEAAAWLKKAAAAFHELANFKDEFLSLQYLSALYEKHQQWSEAAQTFDQARTLAQVNHDRGLEGNMLYRAGRDYRSAGDFPTAVSRFQDGLQAQIDTHNEDGKTYILEELGSTASQSGDGKMAQEWYRRAAEIQHELHRPRREAGDLYSVAYSWDGSGSLDDALAALHTALTISREQKDRRMEGSSLQVLGFLLQNTDRWNESYTYSQQAAAVFADLHDTEWQAKSLTQAGKAATHLLRFDDAAAAYQKAAAIWHARGSDRGFEANDYLLLSEVYARAHRPQDESEMAQKALPLLRETGSPGDVAAALAQIADVDEQKGDLKGAVEALRQSVDAVQQTGDPLSTARLQSSLAFDLLRLGGSGGDNADAARNFADAVPVYYRASGEWRADIATALDGLMRAAQARRHPDAAIRFGKLALRLALAAPEPTPRTQTDPGEIGGTYERTPAQIRETLANLLQSQHRLGEARQVRSGSAAAAITFTAAERDWTARYGRLADRLTSDGVRWRALQDSMQQRGAGQPSAARVREWGDVEQARLDDSAAFTRFLLEPLGLTPSEAAATP